jgi:hypothetical protein
LNAMNQALNTTPDDYAIVFAFPMTIQLNGILPIINNSSNSVNLTIGNPGSTPTVTIDGNSGAYPGFFIPIGNVTIQNMIFQNMSAKGGNGGDGISGGGGGMGAGGAIYAPQTFLNGSNPVITEALEAPVVVVLVEMAVMSLYRLTTCSAAVAAVVVASDPAPPLAP